MNKLVLTFASALFCASMAQGALFTYNTVLSGAAESPATNSLGTGTGKVIYNSTAHTLEVIVVFSGLSGTTTASHIHCCLTQPEVGNAGVATQTPTFAGFPLGVTSGSYDQTFDLTQAASWNSAFITAQGGISQAETALAAGLANGTSYLNIHTSTFPGGEVRGFLAPEPSTFALGLLSAAGLFFARKRLHRA